MKHKQDEIQKTTIELKDRVVVLSLVPFNSDVDMDNFTIIQSHNIMGEILTCSVALNRLGNMLAEVEELLSEAKLDMEIFQAQMKEEQRKKLEFSTTDVKGNIKVTRPTQDEVESAVIRLPQYKVKKLNFIKLQKNRDIVNAWYWSQKSKDEKLNKISEKLRPEDFEKEILDGVINGVLMKSVKKAIK